jgi:O-antigen ligase
MPLEHAAASLPSGVSPALRPAGNVPRLGLYLLLCYLFVVFGRLPDMLSMTFHSSFFLAVSLWAFLLLAIFLSGNVRRPFDALAGRLLILLFLWLIVCIPFSYWRSGSLQWITSPLRAFVLYLGLTSLLVTVNDCRKVMHWLALSLLLDLLSLAIFGVSIDGRLVAVAGTLGNANEVAGLAVMLSPFWLLIASSPDRSKFVRVIAFLVLLISIAVVVKTGSRGGLIAVVLLFVVYFFSAPTLTKWKMLAVVPVLIASIPFFPASTLARYRTLFSDSVSTEPSLDGGAVGSTIARKELVWQSMRITLTHPLFGVGPGVYAAAVAEIAGREGEHSSWQVAHNGFLQIAAEAGLPALAIYLAILLSSWRLLSRLRKSALMHPDKTEIARAALHLRLTLSAFCVYCCFASVAFEFYFFAWVGLTVALARAGNEDLAAGIATGASMAPAASAAIHARSRLPVIR